MSRCPKEKPARWAAGFDVNVCYSGQVKGTGFSHLLIDARMVRICSSSSGSEVPAPQYATIIFMPCSVETFFMGKTRCFGTMQGNMVVGFMEDG